MRTPVFELHILPMFRATDRVHMRVQVDLWDYDQVVSNAERILRYLTGEDDRPVMPPYGSGGPWPEEWIQLFRRWANTGCKRLELGTAQYTVDQAVSVILATGTFPAAGYTGWLQIETATGTSRTYALYLEAPEAAVAGLGDPFSLEEPYDSREAQTIYVRDSTGVHQIL